MEGVPCFLAILPGLRGCANREQRVCLRGGHELLDHLGSCSSFPMKEHLRARTPTFHHRTYMGTVLRFTARSEDRHDSPLLADTLNPIQRLGELPDRASVHLDRAYDSHATRQKLATRRLRAEISEKGKPAPVTATKRWVVERTSSWHNAHKKLVWCTERKGRVVDFWIAFSNVIIVRRLIRKAWTSYRWESRPRRKP